MRKITSSLLVLVAMLFTASLAGCSDGAKAKRDAEEKEKQSKLEAAKAAQAAADLDKARSAERVKLQGTSWRDSAIVAGTPKPGEDYRFAQGLSFRGDKLVFGDYINDKLKEEEVAYTLDPTKNPKTIDFSHSKQANVKAIYEVEGNILKLAWIRKGNERPKNFTNIDDDMVIWYLEAPSEPITKVGEYQRFRGMVVKVFETKGSLDFNIQFTFIKDTPPAFNAPAKLMKDDAYWVIYPETLGTTWIFWGSTLYRVELKDNIGTQSVVAANPAAAIAAMPKVMVDALPKEFVAKHKGK